MTTPPWSRENVLVYYYYIVMLNVAVYFQFAKFVLDFGIQFVVLLLHNCH